MRSRTVAGCAGTTQFSITQSCTTTRMGPPIDYQALLPVELWLACWTLCSHRQLRRVALVCHVFRSLALPLLYRQQHFDLFALGVRLTQDNWIERVRHIHRTAVRLDRLTEGPYASFVQSWRVTFSHSSRMVGSHRDIQNIQLFNDMYDRVVMTFCKTLRLYHNLSSLHIRYFTIDAAFRQSLTSLSNLEDLKLDNCYISAATGFLQLRSLKVCGMNPMYGGGPLQIASPGSLRAIEVDHQISLLIAGFRSAKLQHLVHLSMQVVREVEALFSFLGQCPRLESLVIRGVYKGSVLPPSVPPTTIPLLHSITGPPDIIQLLAPNRPVTSVSVLHAGGSSGEQSMEYLVSVCMDISCSSAPLYSLSLLRTSPTLEALAAITSLFPELKELCITVDGMRGSACGRPTYSGGRSVDRRWVDLCDETAFDDPSPDEVSDDEEEEPSIIIVTEATHPYKTSGFKRTFDWISGGLLSLPPRLEVLQMEVHGFSLWGLSVAEQYAAIAALSRLCPLLREVQFGSLESNWKRNGNLWKSGENKSRIRIL
ncbi:hypothetical protein MVEN_00157300 [Mycena venus]|uniref:F-box domain-containing protein n=1 Tax=Mycena venus TaxID=2733690 RepID=A0A8H6Z024_9AGAR|nr:hypothetical protein MVEN_00157300 [Mycena venus]